MENIGEVFFSFFFMIFCLLAIAAFFPIAAYIAIKMSEFLKLNNDFGDE